MQGGFKGAIWGDFHRYFIDHRLQKLKACAFKKIMILHQKRSDFSGFSDILLIVNLRKRIMLKSKIARNFKTTSHKHVHVFQ